MCETNRPNQDLLISYKYLMYIYLQKHKRSMERAATIFRIVLIDRYATTEEGRESKIGINPYQTTTNGYGR